MIYAIINKKALLHGLKTYVIILDSVYKVK